MSKFKAGDRVVLKDTSGVSLFFHNTGTCHAHAVPRGQLGTVTFCCVYGHLNNQVVVRFDGDNEDSQNLHEWRFEKVVPDVSISKKVFLPCSHDYQELEDSIVLPCFQIGKEPLLGNWLKKAGGDLDL